ncbi:MAG: hypothetical protein ACPGQL_06310 [Thermoplasmatota archaeon]
MRLLVAALLFAFVLPAAAVPVAVYEETDSFDEDSITTLGWLVDADSGDAVVADGELHLTTTAGPFVPYVRVHQVGLFGPGGATVEADVDGDSFGVFVVGFDASEGAISLVITDDSANLFSTSYGGIIIDSAVGPTSWPAGGITARVELTDAGATGTITDAGGNVLWTDSVATLWGPAALEWELFMQAYSTFVTDDAAFRVDEVRFSQFYEWL